MNFRIVKYCDGVLFAIEEFIKGAWEYVPRIRVMNESGEISIGDWATDNIESARAFIARRMAKEQERVIETM